MPQMPAFYIADHAALDFLNSVCAPTGEPIDWLEDGQGLTSWMVGAGILTIAAAAKIKAALSEKELNQAAKDARLLREAFREMTASLEIKEAESFRDSDLELLNRWLGVPLSGRAILLGAKGELTSSPDPDVRSGNQLVRLLADKIANFLVETNLEQLRQCEGPTCTLYFRDTTKNRTRRWCSMAVCGNRAKAARFRKQKVRAVSIRSELI